MTTGFLSAQLDDVGGLVTCRVIANFAWQHMKSATLFRNQVIRLETEHKSEPVGPFFEELRSYASACVMATGASLEALINECFMAHTSPLRTTLANFEDDFWGKLNCAGTKRHGGIEGYRILDKFQHALALMNASTFDEQTSPYRETAVLVEFRNALTHHKPTWDAQRQRVTDLVRELTGRFSLSPFMSTGNDFISERCMSAGCAQWCVSTAIAFISEFEARTHLEPDKFAAIKALL
jgi:hypothetical protein